VPVLVPEPVVVEVWRGGCGRRARLARFFNDGLAVGRPRIVDLDLATAEGAGVLLGRAPMSVTDAAVRLCVLVTRGSVVTGDPRDIGRFIPPERIRVV
jgi:hypothetical protein